ncbi:glycine zipper family protein [Sediminibacter sp. Hel_I_10]|uniref:glycine zipper family protein n=1 Tax=Sediminibacter sp. Hel_I_10 TaxID=1392490 RepID=UPI00047C768A|nr:glycine zipper family protein [Sediminibacter sp. Hel_I_10]
MEIIALKQRQDSNENLKIARAFVQFETLISELKKRELPDHIVNFVNTAVSKVNSSSEDEKPFRNLLKTSQTAVIQELEKELKLVPKNHYRNKWLAIGMAVFGIPLGAAFGAIIGNMGLIALGLPIGMVFGMALGSKMDEKAREEGRQLDLEIKY